MDSHHLAPLRGQRRLQMRHAETCERILMLHSNHSGSKVRQIRRTLRLMDAPTHRRGSEGAVRPSYVAISSAICCAGPPLIDKAVNEIRRSLLRGSGPVQLCLQGIRPQARVLLVVGPRLDRDVMAFGGLAQGADGGLSLGDVGERVPVI